MKHVGTSQWVVDRFVAGDPGWYSTPKAQVPGGVRVFVEQQRDGNIALYSYRTIVALRLTDGSIAITPRRYGPATGKLLGKVRRHLYPTPMTVGGEPRSITVTVAIPGRYGGWGIPWASSTHESLPFIVYAPRS